VPVTCVKDERTLLERVRIGREGRWSLLANVFDFFLIIYVYFFYKKTCLSRSCPIGPYGDVTLVAAVGSDKDWMILKL